MSFVERLIHISACGRSARSLAEAAYGSKYLPRLQSKTLLARQPDRLSGVAWAGPRWAALGWAAGTFRFSIRSASLRRIVIEGVGFSKPGPGRAGLCRVRRVRDARPLGLCTGHALTRRGRGLHPEIRLIFLEFDQISVLLIKHFSCNNTILFELN